MLFGASLQHPFGSQIRTDFCLLTMQRDHNILSASRINYKLEFGKKLEGGGLEEAVGKFFYK